MAVLDGVAEEGRSGQAGRVLSKPGPEDLCASYPLGVYSVVVVSPSFRGVSCSVPRFPLLKKAFFRTQALGLPRLS